MRREKEKLCNRCGWEREGDNISLVIAYSAVISDRNDRAIEHPNQQLSIRTTLHNNFPYFSWGPPEWNSLKDHWWVVVVPGPLS